MKRSLFSTLLLLALPLLLCAQSRGSYFFENSLLRHKLNPAFAPQVRYVSVPVLGSTSVDAASNIGLGNFIFQYRNKSYPFLSEQIDAKTFLNKLPRRDPYVAERIETDLLGGGMPVGESGYATVSLSLEESGSLTVPNSLLRFAKLGRTADTEAWDIEDLQGCLYGYASLAAGYSHDLDWLVEGLRVGARAKLLVGITAAQARIDRISVRMEEDLFAVNTLGSGKLSGFGYDAADNRFSWRGFGLRGLGTAIDLGAEYGLPLDGFFEGINFSASVTDLGFIWFNRRLKQVSTDASFAFSGFDDLGDGISEQVAALTDELQGLVRPDVSDGRGFVQTLTPSIHVGADAPFYVLAFRMHAGLLYYRAVGHDNLMASYGISPFEWLNLGLNWTFLGPTGRFGFYAEYIPKKYISVFFGMERAGYRRNSDHLAIRNFTDSFAFGINVLL